MIDAPPPSVQHVYDAAGLYLARQGLAPRVRGMVTGIEREPFGHKKADAAVIPTTGETRLSPTTARSFEVLWTARTDQRVQSIQVEAAHDALHEQGHIFAPESPEGPVDAVALDHAHDLADRYTGRAWYRHYIASGYPAQVAQVRDVSAAACGTGWRSACARAAREAILRWEAVRG